MNYQTDSKSTSCNLAYHREIIIAEYRLFGFRVKVDVTPIYNLSENSITKTDIEYMKYRLDRACR